jgi:LEA14-like dessication related protein
MNRTTLCSLLILIVLTCAGCSVLVQEPRISVSSTSITGIDTSGIELEFSLAVENPNPFDLALQGYTFDLQVMSLPFSHGGNPFKFVFPAGKQSQMQLPMRVSYGDLIEIIKRRPDLDKIPYQMDARLNIETPAGELILPVKKSDLISVPESYRPGTYLKRLLQPLLELP